MVYDRPVSNFTAVDFKKDPAVSLGGRAAGAWNWPLTSIYCRGQECVDLYLHPPIRLHGVVLS